LKILGFGLVHFVNNVPHHTTSPITKMKRIDQTRKEGVKKIREAKSLKDAYKAYRETRKGVTKAGRE
jgi:hypothetical protein